MFGVETRVPRPRFLREHQGARLVMLRDTVVAALAFWPSSCHLFCIWSSPGSPSQYHRLLHAIQSRQQIPSTHLASSSILHHFSQSGAGVAQFPGGDRLPAVAPCLPGLWFGGGAVAEGRGQGQGQGRSTAGGRHRTLVLGSPWGAWRLGGKSGKPY